MVATKRLMNIPLFKLLLCTLIGAVCSLSPQQLSDSYIVNLGYAQYQGVYDSSTNVTNYRGVRYAAPPTGDLRWRAPQVPEYVSGVQQASTDPPSCFQAPAGGPPDGFSTEVAAEAEDCLFLNVAFPGARIPPKGLPVVIWIHGGGYIFGNASQWHASDLIKGSRDSVVAVVIQYRLGLFGFLAGNKVKKDGALNAGLLDQNFALRWVHDNISKFGGDPTQVTIWGQSAGGGSVLQHVIAEDGQTSPKLFKAAISSSTALSSQYEYNNDIPENLYNEVVSQANCLSSSDSLACLRAAAVELLATANVNINTAGFFGTPTFVPVIDGTFITQSPTAALRQGKLNGETLLAVGNMNEGVLFVNQTAPANVSQYARDLFPKFGLREADAVVQQYKGLGTKLDQVNLIMGEAIFVCPTYLITEAFKDHAYRGLFAIPPALHGDDLNYYFPTSPLSLPTNFNNSNFQKAFSDSFLSFVVHQNPNVKLDPTSILPKWNKFSDGHNEMVFNRTNNAPDIHIVTADQALLERCKFWESVAMFTGQ